MTAALLSFDAALKRLELGERLVRRNPIYYGSAARELAAVRRMDLNDRIQWTRGRLEKILRAARRTKYGKHLGAPASIEDWPILRKERVRDDWRAFVAGRTWLSARASTGGTTGVPLQLVRSPESVVVEQVCLDHMVQLLGCDPVTARVAVLRGDNIKDPSDTSPPFWRYDLGGRKLVFSSNHLSSGTLAHFVEALTKFEPELLWMYPTTLESLCVLLSKAGQRLSVPCVLTSSEMLHEPVWRMAQMVLGCKIIDYYGQAERVAFAYGLNPGRYSFLPGYAHVELVRRASRDEEMLYEVIGTSLWNRAMPLVRYATGDLIRVPHSYGRQELIEVAYGLRPFDGVIGRTLDILLAPDAKGVLTGINQIPRSVEHLLRLQIVQDAPDRVILRALVSADFSAADADHLLRNARQKIPGSVRIDFEIVEKLERTPLGKTPFILHSPEVKELLRATGYYVDEP
ncbi:MAG TPA: hypothetical protein VF161_05540 [Steroidobacteraceae bacterium]